MPFRLYAFPGSRIGLALKKKLLRFDDQKLAHIAYWTIFDRRITRLFLSAKPVLEAGGVYVVESQRGGV